ncbi:DUF4179 domain-containing protein [Aneurinibacillus migulanus]|uniref:DUF4179 domain-containing protein n=1 Tax=Aneurinibacillus migulanus TaxID=47500 RepID=UPI0020A1F14D|nr:DUF4179 domain-containing protein [Aneurinibacillus migulanus]MCP1355336.1 DUF4179 domain-containing protein [Aneurinibacillus migulanus]
MKCVEYEQMSRHVENETTGRERMAIDTHLLDCTVCRKLYEECIAEREALQQAVRAPKLPASFTADVLAQLEPYPDVVKRPQKEPQVYTKRKWKKWVYAAAGGFLALSVAASVSPSFASYLTKSIFNRGNQMIDQGLQMAGERGFVQQGDYHVSDNGVTLRVLDIVADPTRVALSYTLEKESGGHLDPDFEPRLDGNKVYITDTNGKKLADISNWTRNDPYGIIGFQLEKNIPEKVIVHFELSRVGGFAGIGTKEGNWNLQLPVDMKKGIEATHSVAVNQHHTTKQGVTIDVKKLLFAPSKSQLEIVTSLSESAREQMRRSIEQERRLGLKTEEIGPQDESSYGISYRLIDEGGRVVAGKSGPVHPSREQEKNNIDSTGSHDTSGRITWRDSFVPLGEAKRLIFVLDAVDIEEAADFTLEFAPDTVKAKPITGQYQGNTITVKDFTINTEWDMKKTPPFFNDNSHAIIEMEGVQTNETGTLFNWVAIDENGKAYKAMMSGSEDDPDASGNRKFTSTLRIYGMKHKPEQLTLKLTRVMKRYTDVNWKADIPLNR